MKKLIALLLAMIMVCSLATVAFAADDDYKDKLDVDPVLNKTYTENNGDAPNETFTFEFEAKSFVDNEGKAGTTADVPPIAPVTMEYTGTAELSYELNLDASTFPKLGVYTYEITEVIPETKTAGTTYETNPIFMVVTVLYDETTNKQFVAALHYETLTGDKTKGFENTYDAGQLEITKNIAGNMADMTAKFPFSVTFTPENGTAFDADVQILTDAADTQRVYDKKVNDDGTVTITFELGHEDTATFTNIPARTKYEVVETSGVYESSWTDDKTDGTIDADEEEAVSVTNTLTEGVDTGVALDSAPYIVMLVVAMVGVVALVSKKRYEV